MKQIWATLICVLALTGTLAAQSIRVDPVGVNVNSTGATTVFLTYGGVTGYQPADAAWCGDLISAVPDAGMKCDPGTVFGSLPARYDISTRSGVGGFTDIMSIPPSVSRRAFQAAERGEDSAFFYVRHFVNMRGGRDEYVVVICRMSEGGARSPFALTEVKLSFESDAPIVFLRPGDRVPQIKAEISYNGTGRLQGRWEVVLPGDEFPDTKDLLTEASLPLEERGTQRRYAQLSRFNVFLAPSGRYVLSGPDAALLPATVQGPYLILLRIEASDDRESDSNLAAIGAGPGVVHSGAVAGFPIPVLRYFIGNVQTPAPSVDAVVQLAPPEGASIPSEQALNFAWTEAEGPALYRVEIQTELGAPVVSSLLHPGVGVYRLPPWIREQADSRLRWRVVSLDPDGRPSDETPWRLLQLQRRLQTLGIPAR